jgi:hypothetical protein
MNGGVVSRFVIPRSRFDVKNGCRSAAPIFTTP